jgi:hypothetical protein
MYKPSTYLVVTYLFSYLSTYIGDLFLTELVTKVKPNINSVEVHPQLSNNNRHPVDGVLVGAGSWWLVNCHLHWYLLLLELETIFARDSKIGFHPTRWPSNRKT